MRRPNDGSSAAYLLISAADGQAATVLEQMAEMQGVERCHAIQGPFDIIAKVIGSSPEDLTQGVLNDVQVLAGVARLVACPVVMPPDAT